MASGSIEKRVGKSGKVVWGAVVDIGVDPVTGKRRQRRISAPTKRELEALIQETRTNVQRGTHVEPSKQTVREYLEEWLGAAEGTLRPASYVRYQRAIQNHVLPALGGLRLAALTPARVQKFYNDLAKQGLAASTIALYHNILHRALDKAVVWRLIPHNPCDAVDAPHATVTEMQTWSPDQARAFLTGTVEDPWAALWRLAVMVGMRRGELLALRWADLDLDQGMLAVRRTVTRGKDGLLFGEPKSKTGRRSIALPASCVKALRQHRAKQAQRRLLCGGGSGLRHRHGCRDKLLRHPPGLQAHQRDARTSGHPATRPAPYGGHARPQPGHPSESGAGDARPQRYQHDAQPLQSRLDDDAARGRRSDGCSPRRMTDCDNIVTIYR